MNLPKGDGRSLDAAIRRNPTVRGYCVMGCGQTLFLGDDGYVTCSYIHCPNPGGSNDVLHQRKASLVVGHHPRKRGGEKALHD